MYDAYASRKKPLVRFGTSATKSTENRFSHIQDGNPQNTGLCNSGGVNTFATGAFAPGVTVTDVPYRMLAADAGFKWHGLAVNASLLSMAAVPTFDHGGEMVVSRFVLPKKWEVYGRGLIVFGQFRNSCEYGPGVKWYPLRNHRVYIVAEGLRVFNSPVASIITPYNAGFKGSTSDIRVCHHGHAWREVHKLGHRPAGGAVQTAPPDWRSST